MAFTIDNLEIQIDAQAKNATGGIDKLSRSLVKLKEAVGGTSGLASNLTDISVALGKFSAIPKLNINVGSIAKSINELNSATASFDAARLSQFTTQMQGVADGLTRLSGIGKGQFTSVVNSLKKLPEITQSLHTAALDEFASKMQRLSDAISPLALKMDAVARGFNALPKSVLRSIRATEQHTKSNIKLTNSFGGLFVGLSRTAARFWTLYYSFSRVVDLFADWYTTSNEYTETLNLFNVSLGDAADEAKKYAESVSDAMGIDIAEWMQNQGVFKNLVSGFGIANDAAYTMSQNLSQLTYDMASFFNADVETAFDKLSSAMSGQVKGLREFGIDTTIASLEQYALSKGIDESVRSMTQGEKAMLRYSYIMEKSANLGILNDMAKTILSPANSMRVLKAQIVELERALGNIVSVLATKFVPWVMAAVDLVTEFAETLAKAWGFEVMEFPEVEFDIGGTVEDEVDQAEGAIKELKRQLMGFDELNILKSDKEDENDTSNDLGINLPSYNFMEGLEGLDLEPYKEKLKEVLGIVEKIGAGFLAFKIGADFLSNLEKVSDIIKNIDTKSFADNFGLAAGSTLTISGALIEIQNVMDALKNGFDWENILGIGGGTAAVVGGGALIGNVLGSAVAGAAGGSILSGLLMFIPSIVDMFKNGIDWENAILTPLGATLTGAGVGAIIGMLGGPIGAGLGAAIGLAMGLIIDFEVWLWQKYDEIKAWFVELPIPAQVAIACLGTAFGILTNPLATLVAWVIILVKEFQELPGEIENGISKIKETLANLPTLIKEGFSEFTEWLNNLPTKLKEKLDEMSKKLDELPEEISQWFSDLRTDIEEWFDDLWQPIKDYDWENLGKNIGKWFGDAVKKAYDFVTEKAPKWFEDVGKSFSDGFNKLFTETLPKFFKESVPQMLEDIAEFFKELPDKIDKIVVSVWEGLKGVGSDILDGIFEGFDTVGTAISEFVDGFVKGFKESLGIENSSSTKFSEIGKNIFQGLWDGIKAIWVELEKWWKGLELPELKFKMPHFEWDYKNAIKATGIAKEALEFLNLPTSIPKLSVKWYAGGGFPSMGEMFIAREAGPELVGRIGKKTAVANNDQITQGIASAVYSAMMAAQAEGGGESNTNARIIVQIGERAVGEAAVKFINGQVIQTGSSPLYAL